MNAAQVAKYGAHWTTDNRPGDTHRRARCLHCAFHASEPRRGPKGNALGGSQRLFGKMAAHLREKHADKLVMKLGSAQLALLRVLNRAANHGGNAGGIWHDPGAQAPRRTLDSLVDLGLAERDGAEMRWKLSHAGVDECIRRGMP